MRRSASILACLLLFATLTGAEGSDWCASFSKSGDEVTITANSWDPVMAISHTLADRYGIGVSVEGPIWDFPRDAEDVAISDPEFSAQHNNVHYLVMKPHVVQVQFSTLGNGPPTDIRGLLRQVVEAANREMPYAYRLDTYQIDPDHSGYVLVATKTRNATGAPQDMQPILEHHVTIPPGTRAIAEDAMLMADQLSQQTELRISCCQSVIAGIAWGTAQVPYEAHDKPAREVVTELIRLEQQANSRSAGRHPVFDHWSFGCDGIGSHWCPIELEGQFTAQCRENHDR